MKNVVEALLKLSGSSSLATTIDDVSRESHMLREVVIYHLSKLCELGLISMSDGVIMVNDRLSLALFAVSLGLDIRKVAEHLNWHDFEYFSAQCLEANDYDTFKNVVFTYNSRRYEIDVVAFRKPKVLCVDCKHWGLRKGKVSQLKKAVILHKERVLAFSSFLKRHLNRYRIRSWNYARLYPIIVTLYEEPITIYEGLPIVPIAKFNNFLQSFDVWSDSLLSIPVKFMEKEDHLMDISKR